MKTNKQSTLLLIADDAAIYQDFLKNEPLNIIHVKTDAAALAHLSVSDVILLDFGLPDRNGMDILKYVQQHCPIIVLSAKKTVVNNAVLDGAFDFIEKQFRTSRLIFTLHNALHQHKLSQANDFIKKQWVTVCCFYWCF